MTTPVNTYSIVPTSGTTLTIAGGATDGSGNTYVTGMLNGTASFAGTNLSSTANTGGSGYAAKFNANGTLAWV